MMNLAPLFPGARDNTCVDGRRGISGILYAILNGLTQ